MDLRVLTDPRQGASYDTQPRVARAAEDLGYGSRVELGLGTGFKPCCG